MFANSVSCALVSALLLASSVTLAAPEDDLLKAAGAVSSAPAKAPLEAAAPKPATATESPNVAPAPARKAGEAAAAANVAEHKDAAKAVSTMAVVASKRGGKVPAQATGVGHVDELSREQFAIERLEQEDKRTGVQLSIAEKRRRLQQVSAQNAPIQLPATQQGPIKVVGVEGVAGSLVATLRFSGGEEIEARAGDTLPDGRKVKQVVATGVTLVASGKAEQHIPVVVTTGRAIPASASSLPPERILVPMGGPIPSPSASNVLPAPASTR